MRWFSLLGYEICELIISVYTNLFILVEVGFECIEENVHFGVQINTIYTPSHSVPTLSHVQLQSTQSGKSLAEIRQLWVHMLSLNSKSQRHGLWLSAHLYSLNLEL
jgi:hypothetical protein